jgi:hypothetical protein
MLGHTRTLIASLGGGALLLGTCATGGSADAAPARHAGKPLAPLEIRMTPLPRDKKDAEGQRRLRVSVTPRVDAPRLEVTVTLPAGVSLVRGETRWQAPARARVAQTHELMLNVPATGEQRVVASARLVFPNSPPMARAVGYTFNAKAEAGRPDTGTAPSTTLKEPTSVPRIPIKPRAPAAPPVRATGPRGR